MPFAATTRFRFGLCLWVWVCVCVFLLSQAAIAQVDLGGVQFQNLNGNLGYGYGAQTGVNAESSHSTGLSGNLNSNGYYYNPSFLSFQANTYYARAGSTADSVSLSDSEGYNLGAGIFGGTEFPGYVSFGQSLGQSGNFGLPGVSGLNSTNNDRQFGVSWMFRNLPVKNLSVYFSDTANSTDVPGIGLNSDSATKGFGVATGGYKVAGFSLDGGYQHSLSDVTSNLTGADNESFTSHSSSDVFHVMTSRALPWNSNMHLSVYRIMTRASGEGESSNSDSNEFDLSVSSHLWRLPLSGTVSYNDNVWGSVLQQLNGSGQLTDISINGPKIGELNSSVSSSYTLPHHIFLTGFFSHQEEFVMGQSVGATAYGGNISTGFGKYLKGLTVTVGMHDAASQIGNVGAGLVGSANYARNMGGWHLNANANYSQGIQTLLATTTQSGGSAGVSVRRNLAGRLTFGASAGYGRSLFTSVEGQSTKTETAGVNLGWMRQTLSVFYADSSGTSILTSQGPVASPVPGLVSSGIMPYSGKSYSAGYGNSLIKHMSLSLTWAKFESTGTGTGLFSNVSSQTYSGSMTYTYRKLNFISSFTRAKQGASVTTALPSDVTVFYFGISRWFNFF